MASITIHRAWEVDGALTDATSVKLSSADGTYGVKRADTDAVVVADGTDYTKTATGTYEYTISGVVSGVTYVAATEIVYLGKTFRFETTHEGYEAGVIVTQAEVLAELGITSPTAAQETVIDNAILKATSAVRRYLGYDPVQAARTEYYPQRIYSAQTGYNVWEVTDTVAAMRQLSEQAGSELQLQHLPIRSVASLRVDYSAKSGTASGAFAEETAWTEGTDYWANYDGLDGSGNKVCQDGILRSYGSWPTEPGTVRVTYTAGYTANELRGSNSRLDATGIWEAALSEAARRARAVLVMQSGATGLPAGVLASENFGSYSYSSDSASLARLFKGDLSDEAKLLLGPYRNWGYALGS